MKSQDRQNLFESIENAAKDLHRHVGRMSNGNEIKTKDWMSRYVWFMTAIAKLYSTYNGCLWQSTITGEVKHAPLTIEDFWVASALLDLELVKQSAQIHNGRKSMGGHKIKDYCYENALGLLSKRLSWNEKLKICIR